MVMQRWEPFADLKKMEERLARMWSRFPSVPWLGMEEWTVPLDIRDQDGVITVEASLPGIKSEDIDVEIEDNVLTIKGDTRTEKEEKKKGYLLRERSEGSFYRSIRLPEGVDTDRVESTYTDGVLTVTMPKKEAKNSKKVTVKTD